MAGDRLEQLRQSAFWTLARPLRKRVQDPESGALIEADRFGISSEVESVLSHAEQVRQLPTSSLDYFVVEVDEGTTWPGLIHRRTGISTDLVARAETIGLARKVCDLLNRTYSDRARRQLGKRFTSPF
jgi:hypothetical protein